MKPSPSEAPERYLPGKWVITHASGWWWAECPDEEPGDCLCEAFKTHAEAMEHVAKHATEALDS